MSAFLVKISTHSLLSLFPGVLVEFGFVEVLPVEARLVIYRLFTIVGLVTGTSIVPS